MREINVNKKTGLIPSYLKDLFKKKEKKEKEKIDVEVEKVKVTVTAKPKTKTKKIEVKKEEKKVEEIKVEAKIEKKVEEVVETKEEEDKEIKSVKQLSYMFKDEIVQLAKSLNLDEKGNKADVIARIAEHLKLKE